MLPLGMWKWIMDANWNMEYIWLELWHSVMKHKTHPHSTMEYNSLCRLWNKNSLYILQSCHKPQNLIQSNTGSYKRKSKALALLTKTKKVVQLKDAQSYQMTLKSSYVRNMSSLWQCFKVTFGTKTAWTQTLPTNLWSRRFNSV